MKRFRFLLNLTCVLTLALGLIGHTPAAAAPDNQLPAQARSLARPALSAPEMSPASAQPGGGAPAELSASEWAGVQAQIAAAEYQVSWQQDEGAWAYRAPNRAQGFTVAFNGAGFSAAGFSAAGRESAWNFGLALIAYGGQPVRGADLHAERALVTSAHGPALSEWYQNTPEGLKHGLTLYAPPTAGASNLTLDFAITGNLQAELAADGGLRLKNADGATSLAYDGLAVTDAAGRSLPARLALTPDGLRSQRMLRIIIRAAGVLYPLTVDPLLHSEAHILHASDAQNNDYFGDAVAITGDTLVVGAPWESGGPGDPITNTGAAYIFQRNQGGSDAWGQVAILHASDAQPSDEFGWSVSVAGEWIVVGAPYEDGGAGDPITDTGAAYVFQRNQGGADAWGQVAILRGSTPGIGDNFGAAVDIAGDTILVGAPYQDGDPNSQVIDTGSVYIFQQNQGAMNAWGEVKVVYNPDSVPYASFGSAVALDGDVAAVSAGNALGDTGIVYILQRNQGGANAWGMVTYVEDTLWEAGDHFGCSVDISGDTVVVGADGDDGAGNLLKDAGAAYVFQRNQGGADIWGQVTLLSASDAQVDDRFGYRVAIADNTLAVGAYGEDGGPGDMITDTGAAYVFQRIPSTFNIWSEIEILHASDAQSYDYFGEEVAIAGNTLVVGASLEDGGPSDVLYQSGAVYLFNTSGAWQESNNLHASDAQVFDEFGVVAVAGNTLVVGAPYEDGGAGDPITNSGAAYIFQRNQGAGTDWSLVTILHASDAQVEDNFGSSVAIAADLVVVGAPYEDGGPGDARLDAGAAYIFQRNQGGADAWGLVTILRAGDAQAGDQFGFSVAIAGDIVVVGAPIEDGGAGDPVENAGAAYVFSRNEGGADAWGQFIDLHASDLQAGDCFGISVATSGDTIVVGAHNEDGGPGDPIAYAGAVYIFQRNQGEGDAWGEVNILHASDMQAGDSFGISVSISGDTIVVGAFYEGGDPGDTLPYAVGAAYVFQRNQGGADQWGQVAILHASDAQGSDNFGSSVAIAGDTIVVGADGEDGGAGDPIPAGGAAYVFSRNQGGFNAWGQVRTLRAGDAQVGDHFGMSVAIAGDTLVVGAPVVNIASSETGTAYVFTLQAGWEPESLPQPAASQPGDNFGTVALSGDTLVVGAPADGGGSGSPLPNSGAAYIFTRDPANINQWNQTVLLRANDAQANDRFGWAVAIYSDTVAIGAPYEDGGLGDLITDTGAVYLFQRNQGGADAWGQVTVLHASDAQPGDWFGYSLALEGDTLIVGAPGEDGGPGDPLPDAGAVYTFVFTPSGRELDGPYDWGDVGILSAGPGAGAGDQFGYSVSLSGSDLAVGAPFEDGGSGNPLSDAGAVYTFVFTPPARGLDGPYDWGDVGILSAGPGSGAGDRFGSSLALSGSTLIVGAPFEDGGAGDPQTDAGAAYTFVFTPSTRGLDGPYDWGDVGILSAGPGSGAGDHFGSSLALSGSTLIVGAPFEDGGAGDPQTDAGAAYTFFFTPPSVGLVEPYDWGDIGILSAGPRAGAGDRFGSALAFSGETLVIGAPFEDGGVGNPLTDTGTAYIYQLVLPNVSPLALNDSVTILPESSNNLLDVLANDSDANEDALVITAVGAPAHGNALDNDLNVLYTPAPGFVGADTFTYTVADGNGGYATAVVNVTVIAAPEADDLAFSLPEDTVYTGTLTATDPNNRTLNYTLATAPQHGTAQVAAGGTFTYTPTLNYHGADFLTFIVSNGILTDTGRVTATVTSVLYTTTLNLVSVPSGSSAVGQSVTFTATVSASGGSSPIPTGTLVFRDAATTLLTTTLDANGQAVFTTAALTLGTHTITAEYQGTDDYLPASDTLTHIVAHIATTLNLVSVPAGSSIVGQSVTFTATVSASGGSSSIPTGTLVFRDAATTLLTTTLDANGQAVFTTAAFTPGIHTITAEYQGTEDYLPASDTLTHTVAYIATTLNLVSVPSGSSIVGQSVTFTATVSASGGSSPGTPTGTLVFRDAATILLTTTLDANGQAAFTTAALTPGTHTITAEYLGTEDYLPASDTLTHTVAHLAATLNLVAAQPSPSAVGESVTFTATVSASSGSSLGTPTGTLVFREGLTTLLTTALDVNGRAVFTTATLTAGTHTITAEYLGTEDYLPASDTLTHTVVYIADVQASISVEVDSTNVTYTVVITNAGINIADGAHVRASFSTQLMDLQWNCSASGGATCTPSGSGNIDAVLTSFPVGSVVTYTVTAQRVSWTNLTAIVTVNLPAGFIDPNPDNNRATYQAVFRMLFPLLPER